MSQGDESLLLERYDGIKKLAQFRTWTPTVSAADLAQDAVVKLIENGHFHDEAMSPEEFRKKASSVVRNSFRQTYEAMKRLQPLEEQRQARQVDGLNIEAKQEAQDLIRHIATICDAKAMASILGKDFDKHNATYWESVFPGITEETMKLQVVTESDKTRLRKQKSRAIRRIKTYLAKVGITIILLMALLQAGVASIQPSTPSAPPVHVAAVDSKTC